MKREDMDTNVAAEKMDSVGLKMERHYSKEGIHPFDEIEWERRTASISNDTGGVVFEQDNVEAPANWSMLATNIAASKYFYGDTGEGEREHSIKQLVHRVARAIADKGMKDGTFASEEDADIFYQELVYVCVNQFAAFNSPVWFNVGLADQYGVRSPDTCSFRWSATAQAIVETEDSYTHPQASACFIQSVDDTLDSIMTLAKSEARLFKYGSGTGTNLSPIRSSMETLSGGGEPSGPLSFMRVFDQVAGVIKSGGKTRRAAKMQILDIDHPDVEQFISCKQNEEKKAQALIAAGYDGSFNGEAWESVMYQNANLSVRVSDEFMKAVLDDREWALRSRTGGESLKRVKARDLMKQIAGAAHSCGDPGLQYDTIINSWHTCRETARINASNPCSEFMFIDDSACNLSSVNLMKYLQKDGSLDTEGLRYTVRLLTTAQDILVDSSSYPTQPIAQNSHDFRPLGLGYANLGALLMRMGLPYDSDEGRHYAGAVTALLTGYAYEMSSELAPVKGCFAGYEKNKNCMQKVIQRHAAAVGGLDSTKVPEELISRSREVWSSVESISAVNGFRNSQVTVLAPTGTIGFLMDCDTTGVEPDIALVKYKQLAGGGLMKLVNRSVASALETLGYSEDVISQVTEYIEEHDTIEGAPGIAEADIKVFDCAFRPANGTRSIPYQAHLRMMAAVQPFLSGAISKTVNMQTEATVEEIMDVYIESWKMGIKAVAVYRDGSKGIQPVNTGDSSMNDAVEDVLSDAPRGAVRRRLSDLRHSLTHKFSIAGHEGYLTVGLYEDGAPGELFISMAKEGSTVGGIMDAFGIAISLCLQYGVSVGELVRKFSHCRFEPSGFTRNTEIPMAKSIVDYIFRWLGVTFPDGVSTHHSKAVLSGASAGAPVAKSASDVTEDGPAPDRVDAMFENFMEDAPACDQCGSITVRNGTCYRCHNCGNSIGCS